MSVAANRYARALIDVLYPQKAEAGLQQLRDFLSILNDQQDARRFLENPTVAAERRKRLLKEIFEALGLDRRVGNFIGILVDRDRLPSLEEVIRAFPWITGTPRSNSSLKSRAPVAISIATTLSRISSNPLMTW